MGNFFVVVPSAGKQSEADKIFRSGLESAHQLGFAAAQLTARTEWASAAVYPRRNGSGSRIATDSGTGSWLLAIGSWFHRDGYTAGAESRLLGRYLAAGPAELSRELEGFFVIVIGDARTREVVTLTDLVGSCHGFVRASQNWTALSGSSLLLAALSDSTLDPVGCQEFLSTGIIYEDRTYYKEVRKLGPASIFRYRSGVNAGQQRYWQITDLDPESLNGEDSIRKLWAVLVRAVGRVRDSSLRPVCDLTGGYDSRVLTAAFLAVNAHFSTVVSGAPSCRDVVVSRGLAQQLSLPHLHVEPDVNITFEHLRKVLAFTDGECDLFEYARVLHVHEILSERFDLSINGSFGELARGYWWELLFPRAGARRRLDASMLARLRFAAHPTNVSIFHPELRLNLVDHFAATIERTNAGLFDLPNSLQVDHAYLMMRMQRWQGRIASSTNRLWPCLSPFLFSSVLETILQTQTFLRRRGLLVRKMLAEFQPQLARYPLEQGYPALPVTWRTIYRFWPVPLYYGKKLLKKGLLQLGYVDARRVPSVRSSKAIQFWKQEEAQALLRPAGMKSAALFDSTALEAFIERSRLGNFVPNGGWSRLLTLEYTLQVLDQLRPKWID